MHTYDDTETHASLVRTFPDLTGWSLTNLLGQYADDVAAYQEALRVEDEQTQRQRSADIDRVAAEIERRTLDRDTHVCRLGGVGIKELYVLASRLHVELSALVGAIVEVADAEVEQ